MWNTGLTQIGIKELIYKVINTTVFLVIYPDTGNI